MASPKQFQDDVTSPALQRARARAPYAASTSEPPRAFPRLVPRSHARPKTVSESTLSSRRAPSGRERPMDRRSVPCLPAVHSSLGRHLLLGTSPSILGRHKGALPPSASSRAALLPLRPARPPAPLSTVPATASCKLRPAAYQNELHPTFPCIHQSSSTAPRPLHRAHAAGISVAAATVPGRRRCPSPALSPPQLSPGIGPLGPKDPPPPVPGRPRPAVGRNLAGPPLPGRQVHIAKRNFFPGSLLQKVNSNSKSVFSVSCKLRRKS
jgi:hypothetical protein